MEMVSERVLGATQIVYGLTPLSLSLYYLASAIADRERAKALLFPSGNSLISEQGRVRYLHGVYVPLAVGSLAPCSTTCPAAFLASSSATCSQNV